jgi:agmatine deiminase
MAKPQTQSPFFHGFRMPAEWDRHEATWLAWPHEESDWPGKFEALPWLYGEIVRQLARVETIHLIVRDESMEAQVRTTLGLCHVNLDGVRFFHAPTDRSWTRDFCPTFLKSEAFDLDSAYAAITQPEPARLAAINWHFNGWAKYDNWGQDDAVTTILAPQLGLDVFIPILNGHRVVLEGGSIDVNGAGSILTTEECLLSEVQARNPQVSREAYQKVFSEYLGARHTVWLRNGIAGDDTHGHVDDLARFVNEGTIVVASEQDRSEANYEPLRENLALLKEARDQGGRPFRVVTLPMPEPVYFDGQRLPASYANFYIANELVLVPTFNDKNDRVALNTLAELFPEHRVVGIAATDLVLGLGTLHCMTQQQPAL